MTIQLDDEKLTAFALGELDEGSATLRRALREASEEEGEGRALVEAALGMAAAMLARGLGIDAARFAKDRASTAVVKRVEAEGAIAFELDAKGTPSFFINGKKQVGWGSARGLARMIEREKAAVEKLMAEGKSREDAIKARIKTNSEKPEFYLSKLAP